MLVFGLVPLGCAQPAFASSVERLVAAIWLAAVLSLLLPRSPSVHPLISSFWRMVQILFDRIWRCSVVLLLDVEL